MVYQDDSSHIPVLLNEVLANLNSQQNDIIVDGTFGAGGYSKAILDYANCRVIGVDRDPDVINLANKVKQSYGSRFDFVSGRFSQIREILDNLSIRHVNGLVLDLGVSSMQLDNPERGFSFMHSGDLDMRMEKNGISARDIVNSFPEEKLANLIYELGDERNSRKIAKKIVEERKISSIEDTSRLRSIIHSVSRKIGKIDSATKTFQAIRIFINEELEELKILLENSKDILMPGGRIVIVSFHSLEDRIVKYFLRENKENFNILTKKVIMPQYSEVRLNPRSRSSKLRAAVRR